MVINIIKHLVVLNDRGNSDTLCLRITQNGVRWRSSICLGLRNLDVGRNNIILLQSYGRHTSYQIRF